MDSRPKHTVYCDGGCEDSPSCLNCPLPHCKYDAPHERVALRNQQMLAAQREGAKANELALRFGLTQRSVYRILKNGH